MINRKIESELQNFLRDEKKKALLVTGARQVGKTYSIRAFGQQNFRSFVEINFIENAAAKELFQNGQKND